MADVSKKTDGPTPYSPSGYDFTLLPDYDNDFVDEADIEEFAKALTAPEPSPSHDDLTSSNTGSGSLFITALNDWRPIHQRVRRSKTRKKQRPPRRGKDETREGFVYTLLKWPLLAMVLGWLIFLGVAYLLTRLYIYLYEHWVTWRGRREKLRKKLQSTRTYEDWVAAAKELDTYLGNDAWKQTDDYAYYDSKTVRRVRDQMAKLRSRAETEEKEGATDGQSGNRKDIDELRGLVEACVKNNFVGFENPHLYSETYFGTKNLIQSFVDEVSLSLSLLLRTPHLDQESKRTLFKHLHTNFGRTALCLSGGATFAYYHFGVAKALLDADLLPEVITGTSGGALVAALLATRTDDELKQLLVPALAHRITACHDAWTTWLRRWWRTGARFDSVDWARRCAWFCRGSMTFREAYARTGRVLNVTCVPSDPHSPTILANHLTSPDCVIWSAVLASAAVPGILNPVVLMRKTRAGRLEPYSFGHKWKDGSLRTDIPLKALNLHFNVNFSVVSQVNPHINLFFFSSRGSVGRPVTHRRGRGWRGGFLGSATEQYLKLDLTKWLKVLRHLELLPRPLGQDWSEIWLQRFSGTITIWPKSVPSDFAYILSDPSVERLARMIHVGQLSAWPKLKFIANRMKIERVIEQGRRETRPGRTGDGGLRNILSDEDIRGIMREAKHHNGVVAPRPFTTDSSSAASTPDRRKTSPRSHDDQSHDRGVSSDEEEPSSSAEHKRRRQQKRPESPSFSKRVAGWWNAWSPSPHGRSRAPQRPNSMYEFGTAPGRRGSVMNEIGRQSRVFFDDPETEGSAVEGDGDEEELREEAEEEAQREIEEWDVEEDKEKLGMEGERGREQDATQEFLGEEGKRSGTVVG